MDPLIFSSRLRASSLLEAVVASVLFMTVLAISLETLSRLTLSADGSQTRMALDNAMQRCQREYLDRPHENGEHTRDYPWGTLTISLTPYGDAAELQLLVLTARCEKTRQRAQWRRILHNPPENPGHETR